MASGQTNAMLQRLVTDYRRRYVPGQRKMRQRFASMPNLKTAINVAAMARGPKGKCHPHQRRVGSAKLCVYERSLQMVRRRIARCRTFDDLYDLLAAQRTERIGALTIYDTAVRIGAYLGLGPTRVYLHTGTRTGAKALGLDTARGYLGMDELPPALRSLTPDQVEDFLCVYKAAFNGRSGGVGSCSASASGPRWC